MDSTYYSYALFALLYNSLNLNALNAHNQYTVAKLIVLQKLSLSLSEFN